MTTTVSPASITPASTGATRASAVWTHVSEGLWVGARGGEFLGTVEFVDGGFLVADERGATLGRMHSFAGAKRLAEGPVNPEERVLTWRDDHRALAIGWAALVASSVAAIALAAQFLV